MRTDHPSLTAWLAVAVWLFSGTIFLASLLSGVALRCDESCDGSGWRYTADAWQWDIVPLTGGIVLASGTGFLLCVLRGRARGALVFEAIGAAFAIACGSWLGPSWWDHAGRHVGGAAVCVAVIVAGIAAALLASERPERTRSAEPGL